MTLGDQAPVEPLDAEAWDDIERAVFAELDADAPAPSDGSADGSPPAGAPRPQRGRAPLVAAAALLVAASVGLFVLERGDPEETATETAATAQTTRFDGGVEGSRLGLGEIQLSLGPACRGVAIGDDSRGWVVALEHGEASFAVPPREGRPPFVVQAGEVRVEVVGTRFSVERDDDLVRVSVERGRVRISAEGDAVELEAGGRWSNAPEPTPSDLLGELAETSLETAIVPAEPSPSAQQLFERAAALETGDPDQALRLYARVARLPGAWRAPALYARGRLALERGHREDGRRLLRRYLELDPDGVNAQDARALLSQP